MADHSPDERTVTFRLTTSSGSGRKGANGLGRQGGGRSPGVVMSLGIVALGILNGFVIALLAVGLVLVYRANRFLNLAHAQLGTIPALLLGKFVLDWGWSWWLALLPCVALGIASGVLAERLVIARLRRTTTSTVSLLLVTIGLTQLLLALTYIPALGPNPDSLDARGYPVPFQSHLAFGGVVFGGQYVLTLVLVPFVIAALAVFLRFSLTGKMIRAAASNPDAARLCGISTGRMSAVTWAVAGGLAALTAILQAPSQGNFDAAALGPELLLLALGAAAFGSFVSIPGALIGGLVIGVAQQMTLAETSNGGDADLVVFAVILGIVFLRSRSIGSVFAGSGAAVEDRAPPKVPELLRDRSLVRHHSAWLGGFSLALAALVPSLPFFGTPSHTFELVLVLVFALVGVSITVLTGWSGQVSLGHFALVGLGAFVTARFAAHGWSLIMLLVVAGVVGAAVMVAVGLPALRVPGLTLAVTSLGLAVVAQEWLFRQPWLGSAQPFGEEVSPPPLLRGLVDPVSQRSIYYVTLGVLAVALLALRALRRSLPGRTAIAVRDNERSAAAFGITPAAVKLSVLALSGFVASMAGVLWADAWRSVSANQFDASLSLAVLAVPVIGGLGSPAGAVAGAAILYIPTYFLSPAFSGLFGQFGHQIGFQLGLGGLGLIAVLMLYPSGIAGAASKVWEVYLERLATSMARRPADSADDLLVVEDLRLRFGGVVALDGASIKVHPGEIVGLIGPNGAGKTTLMNVVSGTLDPDGGSVRVRGEEMLGLAPELRSAFGLGRSFQDANLFPGLTVTETVQLALARSHRVGFLAAALGAPWARAANAATTTRALEVLGRLGLSDWAGSLTSQLSTGTRRICDLAAQVAAEPKVLLLDEPTAGVAQREVEAFGPMLRQIRDELDCSILIVEHDIPLLMELCDRIYALEGGRVIAEGTPAEIRANPAVIASYLGTNGASGSHRTAPRRSKPRRRSSPVGTRGRSS